MIRVNLLKIEKKEVESQEAASEPEFRAKKKTSSGPGLLILIIVLLGGFALYLQQTKSAERHRLAAAEAEKKALEPVLVKLEEVKQQKIFLLDKIDLINRLKDQQGNAIRIMQELSVGLPDWVWLFEATYRNQNILVKGKALSNILISDYMRNLEKCGLFQSVGLVESTQKNQGTNVFMEFTLTLNLKPLQGPKPGPNPEAGKGGAK
jgi:type IV pilus assembly protein PilN